MDKEMSVILRLKGSPKVCQTPHRRFGILVLHQSADHRILRG